MLAVVCLFVYGRDDGYWGQSRAFYDELRGERPVIRTYRFSETRRSNRVCRLGVTKSQKLLFGMRRVLTSFGTCFAYAIIVVS